MRSIHLPARYRRPAAVAVAGVVVVAVIAASLAWPKSAPTPDVARASTSPVPGASAPIAPAGGGYEAVAELTAIDATGPVIGLDTHFRLASVGATPAAELASRLTVEPPLEMAAEADPDGRTVTLTPTEALVPGAVYRFTLRGPSDEELDSWAFQAKQPLRVIETLPGNEATDVPLDTGIEITFDQDGVTDAASHVSIEPPTKGRFEQHGRVLAFAPDALTPATVYTVTVTAGVAVESTGETMAADVTFKFETAAKGKSAEEATTFQFDNDVFESGVSSAPVIDVWGFGDPEHRPAKVRVDVYRFADLDAAVDAFQQLRSFPHWSRWSSSGLVPTAGLPRVVSVDAAFKEYATSRWIGLPKPLPAGWYLVQLAAGTRPAQAILQVTDVAGYLAVSDTRTLVWANDVATGRPLVGATLETDGAAIGTTDARGVAFADTPSSLRPQGKAACPDPCSPVVIVTTKDGRSAFLPATGARYSYEAFADYSFGYESDPGYWALLNSDRTLYRPTDTINIWGVIRNRDSGEVPGTVRLRLDPPPSMNGSHAPLTNLTVTPGPTGAFTASLPVADLTEGGYTIRLALGEKIIQTVGIQVMPFVKPAYRLEVETGRRIYVNGDQIRVTVRAKFFEGTPVPGVPLRIGGAVERNVVTDETGVAIHRTIAKVDRYSLNGPSYQTVEVSPARAEEGEIASSSRDFLVFPARRTVDADSEISGGRVRVTGEVHVVDIDRLERELASAGSIWSLDPRGAPVGGTNVSAHFYELIPSRTRTGTDYDFIEKKAVPVYEFNITERDAGIVRVKTNAQGGYAVSIPASTGGHDHRVLITIGDADGNKATANTYASAASRTAYDNNAAGLDLTTPDEDFDGFSIGDEVDLTMSEPGDTAPGGRYLFFVAQRGLRDATVQSSARFVTTFESWAAPNVDIGAVRFTGATYVSGGPFYAAYRSEDKRLDVDVTVGSPRYAPGDAVNVEVVTRNAKGAPVAATVVLRAVDEKLFAIGGADDIDPLGSLYAGVPSGISSTYSSHRLPRNENDGRDTAGGGGDDRFDFRDTVLFQSVETGADGRGSVSFKVSDDLTSWRVSAAAFTAALEAGRGSVQVPVGLPFFVDVSIAPEYLVADRPTIQVRAFGSELKAGSAVTVSVTSKSLGFTSATIRTTAFATVGVPLPALTEGVHDLTIAATSGSGAAALTDRLTRRITVVDSRLTRMQTAYVDLEPGVRLDGGDGRTTIVLSDAGVGRHLPLLVDLAGGGGARLDRALAADVAAAYLKDKFGSGAGSGPTDAFDAERYLAADGGLALLPYGSGNLELSALVALVAPNHEASAHLEGYFTTVRFASTETRERRIFALAGLAGLLAPVLPDIQEAAADPDLTIREKLMVALGAAVLGDAATARSIAKSLTTAYGEGLDQQARLRAGSSASDITEATALMAFLAAATGDATAPAYWAYVEANPSSETLHVLHALGYVTRTLDRAAAEPASFAYTLNGAREVVTLARGESFELTLTAAQRASLELERLSGDVGVTTSWRESVAVTEYEGDPDVVVRRTFGPGGTIDTDDLVRVDLTVTFSTKAPRGCYEVTDYAPSGLAPVGALAAWIDPNTGERALPPGVTSPYAQTGQRVSFCVEPTVIATSATSSVELRYYARVVTPGTYAWEPAVVESKTGPDRAAYTSEAEISIR